MRWQAYRHILRQSLSFFHDEFAGRVVAKVWQSGQAMGDFMVSLLQVAWFIAIYAVTTMALVAQLDWRLVAIVGLWIAAFALIARHFVPRIRNRARMTAEAASGINGRLVDGYTNIQTLKLFGREDENDRYIREGFDQFLGSVIPFTRDLTGVRVLLATLSGIMIIAICAMSIDLWLRGEISVGAVAFTLSLVLRLSLLLGRMMTQLNSLMRNYGTIQNSMKLLTRPIVLKDREGAGILRVTESRIRFDRVMLKDAPILILDEATSALDSEIEAAIQENLSALMNGETAIAIAHRLSTIARMDRLVVLESGRIVEDGTHDLLLQKGGLYARLWSRQSGGFIEA